jgi:hypothetical protein
MLSNWRVSALNEIGPAASAAWLVAGSVITVTSDFKILG